MASGIALFNESVLAERGFEASIYHRSLASTAPAALAGNFAAGALAAPGSLRPLLLASMLLLATGLAALPSQPKHTGCCTPSPWASPAGW